MSHRIALVASPNALASSVSTTLDLFMAANRVANGLFGSEQPLFQAQVLSTDGAAVTASNGYPIAVDGAIAGAGPFEAVLVPAFTFEDLPSFERALGESSPLCQWLRKQHQSGALVAASCAGSFVLAEAGLLEGRAATTTWWLAKQFRRRYPHIELRADEMLVDSGSVISAGAALSQIDLALYLIERLGSRQLARLCAKYMVLDGRRASQTPYMLPGPLRSGDPVVAKAESVLAKRLGEEIRIDELAGQLAVSPRTLVRRFQRATGLSPQAFVQRQRVDHARTLLETTELRLAEVLERVGYQDESAFRKLFKRATGYTPGDYARRFGPRRAVG